MRIIFTIIAFLLIIGCTLQEREVNEVLQNLKEMGERLDQLEQLAKEQKFENFKQNVFLANESLTKVRTMIDEAESRGEDPAFIDMVRKDYNYLEIEFSALIISAGLVQKLEATKPLMEELERKHTDKVIPALAQITEIINGIQNLKQTVSSMENASNLMIEEDKELLKTEEAISKMRNTEQQFDKRLKEFQELKNNLERLKEQLHL